MFVIGSNLTEMSGICCVYFERRENAEGRRRGKEGTGLE